MIRPHASTASRADRPDAAPCGSAILVTSGLRRSYGHGAVAVTALDGVSLAWGADRAPH